ncbi:hypothetical protein JCM18899A_44880 [Nocardioides sp. AN3]
MRRIARVLSSIVATLLAVPLLTVPLLGATPANADAVTDPPLELGMHTIDIDGTPTPVAFMNAAFGSHYLYLTAIATTSGAGTSAERFLTAFDMLTGEYVQDWPLPATTSPTTHLLPDGDDTVWVAGMTVGTEVFEVGQPTPLADWPDTVDAAVVGHRAYLLGGRGSSSLTVVDDDPSDGASYLQPTGQTVSADADVLLAGGSHLFLLGNGLSVMNADPDSSAYLTVTDTVADDALRGAASADGSRVVMWHPDGGTGRVYDVSDGTLTPDGTVGDCTSGCGATVFAVDGVRGVAYGMTASDYEHVQVYDLETSSHPKVATIDSFVGAESQNLSASADGTKVTTSGLHPKVLTLKGYAADPVISGPTVAVPGDTVSVDVGYWSTAPTWQWLRDGEPILGTTGATSYSLTIDDVGATLTVSATAAGVGTRTSAAFAVPRPPSIVAAVSGRKGRNGWYAGPATVSFTCTPGTAPIVLCPASVTLPDGTAQQAAGTVTDENGLTATTSVTGIDVDTLPPRAELSVRDGTTYLLRLPLLGCHVQDAHPAGCEVHRSGRGVNRTVTGVGRDLAGNSAVTMAHVHVCRICVLGARYARGSWVVDLGSVHTVEIVSARRPRLVGAGRVVPMHAAGTAYGSRTWYLGVRMPREAGRRTITFHATGRTWRVPLRIR